MGVPGEFPGDRGVPGEFRGRGSSGDSILNDR